MTPPDHHLAFGPIPSRRLGRSLGVNTIPAKACTYGCVYCQVGPTTDRDPEPRDVFPPGEVRDAVARHLAAVRAAGQGVDWLSIVPDGEPTLDRRLGETIDLLRGLGLPVAVFTNGSLLWRPEVRARLARADLVSLKVDTVDPAAWRRVDAPSRGLDLAAVLAGEQAFAREYRGRLITETMLVAGLDDADAGVAATADFVATLHPEIAYLAVPVRPPTRRGVRGPDEASLVRAHAAFAARLPRVELLTGHETAGYAHTGDARSDLLAVLAVHPLREGAIRQLLADDGADWSLVEALEAEGALVSNVYQGDRYWLRPVVRPSRAR